MTLLHLTTADQWAGGRIDPDRDVGFVHLSRPEQLHIPANLLYAGRQDLLLLAIDEAKLVPEVTYETGFPHLQGPLTGGAVIDAAPFPPDADGSFHLVFAPVPAGETPAADLIESMVAEMTDMYGVRIDGDDMPSATPADFDLPKGMFIVGYLDGEPVAGGGVKTLDAATGEIKRMYVAPEARRHHVATRLLAALEGAARRMGHERVRLDTGPKQPHAVALYASAGFVEIDNYNGNPKATYFGEKQLV